MSGTVSEVRHLDTIVKLFETFVELVVLKEEKGV